MVVFTAAALLSVVAGPLSAQSDLPLEERVLRLETMLSSGTLVELLQRVEALQAELQALRGEIEEQSHAVSRVKKDQRELYLDIDRRMTKLETTGTQAAAATGSGDASEATAGGTGTDSTVVSVDESTVTNTASIDPIKEQDAYQTAFNLLKSGRYEEAGEAFRSFLNDYGSGKYADNAQYWLGETYYVRQRFEEAVHHFLTLTEIYPNSAKFPHALLKIGYSQAELGQQDAAKKTFGELISRFPQTPAAKNAEKRLERMKSTTG